MQSIPFKQFLAKTIRVLLAFAVLELLCLYLISNNSIQTQLGLTIMGSILLATLILLHLYYWKNQYKQYHLSESESRQQAVWMSKNYIPHATLSLISLLILYYGISSGQVLVTLLGLCALGGVIYGLMGHKKNMEWANTPVDPTTYNKQKKSAMILIIIWLIGGLVYKVFQLPFWQGLVIAVVPFLFLPDLYKKRNR